MRYDNVHGHLNSESHWGISAAMPKKMPKKALVQELLEDFDFIGNDESVELPQGPLAPFPFLQSYPLVP
jgi:hypothetical protein